MELKTSGKMQMNGFRRNFSASRMRLNVVNPMDKGSPEHYMGVREKKYWRMLPEKEKSKIIARAQLQTERSQGTIFSQGVQSRPYIDGIPQRYRVIRGGKIKAQRKVKQDRQVIYIQYASGSRQSAAQSDSGKCNASGKVHTAIGAPGTATGRGKGLGTVQGNVSARGTTLEWQAKSNSVQGNGVQFDGPSLDIRWTGGDRQYGSRTYGRQGTGTGKIASTSIHNNMSGAAGASEGAAQMGRSAIAATATGGSSAVVQTAKKTAQIVKQNFSMAMQKDEEQRKFNSQAVLAEESNAAIAAVSSPKAAETGIQKAVTAVVAVAAVMIQTALSFLLPFLIVLSLILSLVAGILSFIFGGAASGYARANVSAECEQYRPLVRQYAEKYGMLDYVELIMAVMMQESGGLLPDVMQSAEGAFNTRYPHVPNGIPDPEYSIECGVQELKRALELASCTGPTDMENIKLALQGYNYGEGYITWALSHYGGYSEENAAEFSDMMAAKMGWSGYGDKQYVQHVLRYYEIVSGGFGNVPAGGMEIPLYDQKDYPDVPFGGGSISSSGCAPTSFAMVASYLLGREVTPVDAMSWCGNAYYVPGAGTSWSYFPAAASHFGIRLVGETMDPYTVMQALSEGKPVISSQNPGLFTSAGHFIVLRGVTEAGKILVNDPNDSPSKNYVNREFDMLNEIHVSSANYWIFDR